jgi:hypothetical protein
MGWIAPDFDYPRRLDLDSGHHLRPIEAADAQIDLPAVMGSREALWRVYGEGWGWPPQSLSLEADREDLAHHAEEAQAREGFNYAVLDESEGELFGCVYLYPSDASDADADVSWWLVDAARGSDLERALDAELPRWFESAWGFASVRRHPGPPADG